ncbi:MAG: type I glyceraldehyde-3-phosphate dehydrogenase [Rhizobiaceae bacterium]
MTLKVAINGFGRIGRNVLRAVIEHGRDDIEVVAINDLAPIQTNAHLLCFDSVHGRFPGTVAVDGKTIHVAGPTRRSGDASASDCTIRVTSERDPAALPWGDVDIALECTGIFNARDKAAMHLENGSKRVLISAPGANADRTVVYGVNHEALTADDAVVSNASCTTNCLAPVAKVLHEAFGITKGYMTTIHSYTGDQPTLDTFHKDLYRARAAAMSMIPTSTGAAKAVGLVLPDLKGKLDGSAIRVPTPNVSCIDLNVVAGRDCTVEEINAAIKAASEGALKGVLDYVDDPLVSMDFNHDPHSSNFAAAQTQVTSGNLVRVLSWYDNEWGFSCRMLDTAVVMGKLL